MKLEKRSDGWWVIETPAGVLEVGPSDTKAEAQEDLMGLKRFLKEHDAKLS